MFLKQISFLVRNKFYADLLRSKWYRKQVVVNPRRALNIKWKANYGTSFPWDNPQTLDEKIGWLQINSDTSLWAKLSDKYEVRKYVENMMAEDKLLIPLYGVWETAEEIDFNVLPSSFVIRCTHDSGSTYIVKDKEKEDLTMLREKLKSKLNVKCGDITFEPHYLKIVPKVVAEKLLVNDNTVHSSSLVDYKIWCFNGKPYCVLVCYDRYRDKNGHINVTVDLYSMHPWKPIREKLSERMMNQNFRNIPEPKNLDRMLQIASKLANGVPQVRVDLYNINGQIYFSEMTFTSAAGIHYYFCDDMKREMGAQIKLR